MTTISLQMYSVNAAYVADPEKTLARLAEIGFTTVEAFDFVNRADELAAAFAQHGISAKTGHAFLASTEIPLPDGTTMTAPTHAEVFAAAKTLGLTTVIDPYVDPTRWETREQIAETAALLNAAAKEAAAHGLRVGYHNHGHELSSRIDGVAGLEVLAGLLDPEVVLEVDLYWTAFGGEDLVAVLNRLGDRVIAVHVKDGPIPGDFMTTQVPAGQGDVPLVEGLAAAKSVEYAVIEFDGYAGDILDGVAASFEFLREQGVSA
jgi:sugar phosphate isomerase/epimerase